MSPLASALLQALIGLSGVLAIWLVLHGGTRGRRWGAVIGLVGQPIWLYVTWSAGQYGMLVVSLLYTVVWAEAVWEEWISQPFAVWLRATVRGRRG